MCFHGCNFTLHVLRVDKPDDCWLKMFVFFPREGTSELVKTELCRCSLQASVVRSSFPVTFHWRAHACWFAPLLQNSSEGLSKAWGEGGGFPGRPQTCALPKPLLFLLLWRSKSDPITFTFCMLFSYLLCMFFSGAVYWPMNDWFHTRNQEIEIQVWRQN